MVHVVIAGWESTLNLGDDGGDASSSVRGRGGGGRAKAGKQMKVEMDSNEQDDDSDMRMTATMSLLPSSSSSEGKQEQEDPAMHHHDATSSTTSSSFGEQDSFSMSNTEGEAPTMASSSGGKPPTELQIGVLTTTGDSSIKSAQDPNSSNGHHHDSITPMPSGREKQQSIFR
jgi:hypothetical protein